jgi:VWFA-related protein
MTTRLPLLVVVLGLVCAVALTAAPPGEVWLDLHAFRGDAPEPVLRQDDISVFEDGVPQSVQALRAVGSGPRSIVVFIDAWHMPFEGARDVRVPLSRLLERWLRDDDRVALVVAGVTTPVTLSFGTKTEAIAVVEREETWEHVRIGWRDPKEDRFAQCYPTAQFADLAADLQVRYREGAVLDDLSSVVAQVPSDAPGRTAVVLVGGGWRLVTPRSVSNTRNDGPFSGRGRFGGFGGRGGFGGPGGERRAPDASRTDCDDDRLRLASVNDAMRLDRLADAANRSMVTFYPVYARALLGTVRPGAPLPRLVDPALTDEASRLDALRQLATTTDGVAATDGAAIETVAQRLAADLTNYHVVTYTSTNQKMDNRLRSITVRTVSPGLKVRVRRGYRGASVEEVLDAARATGGGAVPTPVVPAGGGSTGLSVRTVTGLRQDHTSQVWIVGELDYRTRRQVAWTAGGTAEVTVVRADGTTVLARTLDVAPSASAFVVTAPESGGLEPGEYAVKVRLQANNADDVSVAGTARVAVSRAGDAGEGLLWRRGPSTGPRFVPTASSRFLRSERIRLEVPRSGAGVVTAVMLDRLGQPNAVPVTVSERQDESGEFSWVVAEAPLAALAQGQYAIELTVGGTRHRTPFDVVPY